MDKMIVLAFVSCVMGVSPTVLGAAEMQKKMDCSTMSTDIQQFASQMTAANKAIFCGKFTDSQRASAMQMASTQIETGMMMTPDEAVQKVSEASGSKPQGKSPTGCPVK